MEGGGEMSAPPSCPGRRAAHSVAQDHTWHFLIFIFSNASTFAS